jgi:tol-pal system protein YbgF
MIRTMPIRRFAVTTALALSLGAALPSFAQTPMPDPLDARDARRLDRMEQVVRELRSIVYQGRDTGKPVVIQPAETDYQIQDLNRRLSDLELALTRINGQLETSTFELDQARRRSEALQAENKALTERLLVLEQRTAEPPPEVQPVVSADPQEAFSEAKALIDGGDFDAAEQAFAAFVDQHGDSPRAAEAHYWLGKAQAVRNAHVEAAASYIESIRGWPKTDWAPDAVVELSRSLMALKRTTQACQTLAELTRRYPNAAAGVKSRAAATRTQAKCAA